MTIIFFSKYQEKRSILNLEDLNARTGSKRKPQYSLQSHLQNLAPVAETSSIELNKCSCNDRTREETY